MYLSRQLRLTIATMLVMFAVMVVGAFAGTYYVDAGSSSPGDGKSWGAAFLTITDGLAAATTPGDNIYVKTGTYNNENTYPIPVTKANSGVTLAGFGAGVCICSRACCFISTSLGVGCGFGVSHLAFCSFAVFFISSSVGIGFAPAMLQLFSAANVKR